MWRMGGGQPPEKMTDVTKGEAARGLEACGPGGQSSPWSALFDLTLSTSHFPYLCNRIACHGVEGRMGQV